MTNKKRRLGKIIQKKIVKERIKQLFEAAEKFQELGRDYDKTAIRLILRLVQKYKVRLTKEQKMKICKKCYALLIPGKTSVVRLKKATVVVKCLRCGNEKHYPYVKEKKAMKRTKNERNF